MRVLIVLLGAAVALAVLITAIRRESRPAFEVLTPTADPSQPLPKLWPLSDFQLTERSGKPVTLSALKGKVWVADLFYATCPGPCPMLSTRMSELQRALGPDPGVRQVSITSDPESDTPEVLREYAQRYGATDRWLFLTGPKPAIYALANEGFKLGLAEDPKAREPITHSTKLALIDRQGTVRGFYDGLGGDLKRLVADIQRLKAEPQ